MPERVNEKTIDKIICKHNHTCIYHQQKKTQRKQRYRNG